MNMEVTQEFSFMNEVPVVQPKEKDYFFDGYFKGKSRPTYYSKEVVMLVVQKIMPEIVKWFENFEEITEEDIDNIREQLVDVLNNAFDKDGYEIAKELDRYWGSDSELVYILDGLPFIFHDVKLFLVKKWIKDNNISPKYQKGDKVIVESSMLPRKDRQKERYNGEINNIYEDGSYSIFIEDLGHIREGIGTYGIILDWEKIDEAIH
jgi:hypothetical protein